MTMRVHRIGGILMKYPFFISKVTQDNAIYSIHKLLQYYHIREEVNSIKLACNAYEKEVHTENIINCLHQYKIEAKEVAVALNQIKTPCILSCHKDPKYLFIYKRNKKYYMMDSFDTGKCKKKASELAPSYTGRYIEIQHVGRVKKSNAYTSFWKFLCMIIMENKHFVFGLTLFSLLYTSVLVGISELLLLSHQYHRYVITIMFFLLANIMLALTYVRNNMLLLLSQILEKKYVHQKIIHLTVNQTCDLQSKQAILLVRNIIQWIRICSVDAIIWFVILVVLVLRYGNVGIFINIAVLWCCLSYQYYYQLCYKNKCIDISIISKWDLYIKNMCYLYQFQYQKWFVKELDKQYTIKQKEYVIKTIRQHRITWLLSMAIIICIVITCGLWEWLVKNQIVSFWHSLSMILLLFVQVKTVINIYKVLQRCKATKQTFEAYKELPLRPILQEPPLATITSIFLHQIHSTSVKYLDLKITNSIQIQGKQEEIENIFNIIIGRQLTYRGCVYINKQIIARELLPNMQDKVVVLEKHSLFLEESVSFHLLDNRHLQKQALLLLHTFHMEDIIAQANVLLDSYGNPLSLEQKQMVMLVRAILIKPDVILINNGLSAIDSYRYEKILTYLQTCLPDTIVVVFDCLGRKAPLKYDKVIVKEGRVI